MAEQTLIDERSNVVEQINVNRRLTDVLGCDSPRDLPDAMLAEMGVMLARVERAVLTVKGVERVHILRYGEGSAHLHWWFMARPTGVRQTASGFAMIWDDVLPQTPEPIHRANIATVIAAVNLL